MAIALGNGDILSIKAWNSFGAQAAVNTYNFLVFGVIGGGVTDQDFVDQIANQIAAFYTSFMSDQCQHNGCQCYFIRRTGPLPAPVKNVAFAGPGLQPEAAVPRVSASILKYTSFTRGPKGRGRLYLPFMSSVFMGTNGLPTTAHNTLVNSFASVLLSPILVTSGGNTAQLTWVLMGRVPGPIFLTTEQIIAAEAADKFGMMHKRGDYGRANASPI